LPYLRNLAGLRRHVVNGMRGAEFIVELRSHPEKRARYLPVVA
jgi:hypothetical protein